MEVLCIKAASGALVPMGDDEAEKVRKIKSGATVRASIVQMRNGGFFRKWWLLAKFAYDIWSETVPAQQYRGMDVLPDFERFRRDLTILTGFFRPVWNVRGEMRVEPESLKWSEMDEERFERLYSATIDVVLDKIIGKGSMTPEALRAQVDRLMEFDR